MQLNKLQYKTSQSRSNPHVLHQLQHPIGVHLAAHQRPNALRNEWL